MYPRRKGLCSQIGPLGSSISAADRSNLANAIATANAKTTAPIFPQPQPTPRLYAYGSYVDEPLAIVEGSAKTKYYYASNHLCSVAALINGVGAVVERYKYDAYGKQTILSSNGTVAYSPSAYGQYVGFTGRYHDWETGLEYFRHRYLDSGLGSFLGRDPMGYIDGSSLYSGYFCPNSRDPFGLECLSPAKAFDVASTAIRTLEGTSGLGLILQNREGGQIGRGSAAAYAQSILGLIKPEKLIGQSAIAILQGITKGFAEDDAKTGVSAASGNLAAAVVGKLLGFAPDLSEGEIAEKMQEMGADKVAEIIGEKGEDKIKDIITKEADEHLILDNEGFFTVPTKGFSGWAEKQECEQDGKCKYSVRLVWKAVGNDVNDGILRGQSIAVDYEWSLNEKTSELSGQPKRLSAPYIYNNQSRGRE